MRIGDDNTYELLKRGLEVSTERRDLISNNIANVNTEGYKRYYIKFEDAMKGVTDGFELKTTKEAHIDNKFKNGINIKRDESTSSKMDGNNVDIDSEKVDQASNTMMYNALITRANGKLSLSNYIIRGGN